MAPMRVSELVTSDGDAVGDELVEGVDVVGEAADDPAGLLAAEEVERELLEVGEELAAQVEDDVRADPARRGRSAGSWRRG